MTDVASAASGVDAPPTTGMSEDQIIARSYKEHKEGTDALKKNLADRDKLEMPKAPVMQEMPKMETTPMNGWGSAATFLATFGSMLTRRPLTNALNANAEAMEAVKANDTKAFKNAWEKVKVANENAQKSADWQMEVYKTLLGKSDAEARSILGAIKDDTGQMALSAKQFKQHEASFGKQLKAMQDASGYNYVESKVKELEKSNPNMTEADKAEARANFLSEWAYKSSAKASSDKEKSGDGGKIDWDKLKPEDMVPKTGLSLASISQKVDALHKGATYAEVGLSTRGSNNPQRSAVDDLRAIRYPDDDLLNVTLGREAKNTETKIAAKNLEGMQVATDRLDKSIPLLMEKVKAVDPSRFKSWNDFENYLNENTGDPKIVALKQVVEDTKTDFQAVQAKGGQITDAVRNSSNAILDAAWAKGQFQAAADTMIQTSRNQMSAARDSLKSATNKRKGVAGKPPDAKHIQMLKADPSDENKEYFDEAFGEGEADKALGE